MICVACDLVEEHAVYCATIELVGHMPSDGFAFSIGVSREVDGRGGLRCLFQIRQSLCLASDRDVLGHEPLIDINTQLTLREITEMSHRRFDGVASTEVLPDRPGLSW